MQRTHRCREGVASHKRSNYQVWLKQSHQKSTMCRLHSSCDQCWRKERKGRVEITGSLADVWFISNSNMVQPNKVGNKGWWEHNHFQFCVFSSMSMCSFKMAYLCQTISCQELCSLTITCYHLLGSSRVLVTDLTWSKDTEWFISD